MNEPAEFSSQVLITVVDAKLGWPSVSALDATTVVCVGFVEIVDENVEISFTLAVSLYTNMVLIWCLCAVKMGRRTNDCIIRS